MAYIMPPLEVTMVTSELTSSCLDALQAQGLPSSVSALLAWHVSGAGHAAYLDGHPTLLRKHLPLVIFSQPFVVSEAGESIERGLQH